MVAVVARRTRSDHCPIWTAMEADANGNAHVYQRASEEEMGAWMKPF
ncbi:hypothetical protein [Methermicoccus shengliensis]|uniref:Uncharacterized protein n=1 Tax=Methermicoccus shengliensis TaxID=660064 RepID=A0A832RZH1_9EURY|nr:hypothetical protein [Methermicoccus shengliensis]HIH70131.1 hypothetical protein [Methermicoccus shengliensis]